LKQKGFDDNLKKLTGEIRERDRRDAERAASPLTPAVDAETLDTSRMTIDEVVETILARLRSRLPY
jgi:cytidylate kinase